MDVAAIHDLRRAVQDAENAGDAEAVIALLADDAVAMVPDYDVQEGKAACAAFMRAMLPGLIEEFDRRITYSSAEVQFLGDAALDRGTFAFTITPRAGGETGEVTGKYMWLLRQNAGGWKIARLIVARDDPWGEA